jgi:hypothetical protein
MFRSIYLLAVCLLPSLVWGGPKRILFIGNSYTYANDLPGTFKGIALSLGDTVYTSSVAPGGFTFNQHSAYAATLDSIRLGNWDYIVLQEQSQIPAFSPSQVQNDCVPYAKRLSDSIRVHNPCAEIVFFMTWGRKNGDASNCANYPPICTYAGMQQGLYNSYLMLSDSNQATCSPVGAVWRVLRNIHPSIELYSPDESHPSVTGTYLAACTFYSSLFRKPVIYSQYSPGAVTTSDGFYIRQTVDAVVFDSLETWQMHGYLPKAQFTRNVVGATVNFNNTSLRASQYQWDFGDGTAINTSVSPSHTYTNSGTYVVKLTAIGQTCQEAIIKDTLTVQIASGINNIPSNMPPLMVVSNQSVTATFHEAGTWQLYSLQGQCISLLQVQKGKTHTVQVPINGMYLWQWNGQRGKIWIKE